MDWYEIKKNGILIKIWAQPNAPKTEVVGLHGSPCRLKIRIHSPPVDGKANEVLTLFLKDFLGVRAKDVSLVRGHTSRKKDFLCQNVNEEKVKTLNCDARLKE